MTDTPPLDREFHQFLDRVFEAELTRLPERATMIGRREGYDRWSDQSDLGWQVENDAARANLRALGDFPAERLGAAAQFTRRLFAYREQAKLDLFPHRFHCYATNHMMAAHNALPVALINTHVIADQDDAEAYIARLRALPAAFDQALSALAERARRGLLPPRLTFPKIVASIARLMHGVPFEDGAPSPLLGDFLRKLGRSNVDPTISHRLARAAVAALEEAVGPACRKFAAAMEDYRDQAPGDRGLGSLPGGREAYQALLKHETTLDLSPAEIHEIGRAELTRIHEEMRGVAARVGFSGSLREFFAWLLAQKHFYLPESMAGRDEHLRHTRAIVAGMKARLGDLFGRLPRTELEVRPIDRLNEGLVTTGLYTQAAEDGSRPGFLEVNLGRASSTPTYQIEALTYHEGYPGHHLQLSIAMERKELPLFRRHESYNAYREGWAFYAEGLPKEVGLYDDPFTEFGRLSLAAWRACRMIVDPAIHDMGWSREGTIRFMTANLAGTPPHIEGEVDRYFVYPAQATSFGIGLREILRLRESASLVLGNGFDIRDFHDLVLGAGNMPLPMLAELVGDWTIRGGGSA